MTATLAPTPLAAPLPGGRADATVRLHPLLAGEMLSPPGLLDRPGGPLGRLRALGLGVPRSRWLWIPIPAFLIEHPQAGPVLVDTGFHPSVAHDPRPTMGTLATRTSAFRVAPEQALHAQLRARGVDPADVATVVMTHLHWDHACGVSEFPGATFVVDAREWRAANARGGMLRGYRPAQFRHPFAWRELDYAAAGAPHGPFSATIDLFGDGSVRLVSTPGHSLGHQSVLLRLGGREALLTGDAAYTRRTIDAGARPGIVADERAFDSSLEEIRAHLAQRPDTLVIPGHDPDTWSTLDASYA